VPLLGTNTHVSQAGKREVADCAADELGFDSPQSPFSVKWVPGLHFPKAQRQKREADHMPHLVQSLRMADLYFHSPLHLNDAVL
jgi:hypothetical protein